tara:strand:+ start:3126 stop:3398 length:273 start_codon:yes stop_codon:yes gene_type:complete
MDEYRLVKVVWKDIQGLDETWVDMGDMSQFEPVSVETVGWIVVESKEYITVLSSLSADKTFGGSVTSIPKGCVDYISPVCFGQECFGEKI